MKNKVCGSFDEAVADIPSGSTIMFPGFGGVGHARILISALHRQGAKHLTGVSNTVSGQGDRIDVATLVEASPMNRMICAFTAATHPSLITPFVQMYNDDEIEAEPVPQGPLAERMRAAAFGIGGFYTPPASAPSWQRAKSTGTSTGGPTCRSIPCPPTTPSSGLGRPTPSETFSSG